MKNLSRPFFGKNSDKINFLYYPKILSTNLEARKIIKDGIKGWTVILAKTQKKGYGKEKRYWFSPRGGLYFSLLLPNVSIKRFHLLTSMAAISIVKLLRKKFKVEAVIKWPNDVLITSTDLQRKIEDHNFKKIAGILVENIIGEKLGISIIGIGINTNIKKFPKDLSRKATSVEKHTGEKVDNKEILELFLKEFKKIFAESEKEILKEYKKYEILIGRKIKVAFQDKKILGTVLNFDKKGALMIKLRDGKIKKILEGSLEFI